MLLNKYHKAKNYKSESIGPDQYTIPPPKGGQRYSFGQQADQVLHSGGPKHLQFRKYAGPGPGTHTPLEDNFNSKSKNRHNETNWGRANREHADTTKKYPAPNKYNPETKLQPRFLSELPGNKFSQAALDDPNEIRRKQAVPGPGKYEAAPLPKGHAKKILGGPEKPKEKLSEVPGPDNYYPYGKFKAGDEKMPVKGAPGFKIMKHVNFSKEEQKKDYPDSATYIPANPCHVSKGVKIGTSTRAEDKTHVGKPAPNKYVVQGDFDFKDPNNREESLGKDPQFHFGMNTKTRDRNLDMPGPGEYDMNVYPSN